jgi:hypothetical protein
MSDTSDSEISDSEHSDPIPPEPSSEPSYHSDECAICLEKFNEESHNTHTLECGHRYHMNCIINTLRQTEVKSCPLCRSSPAYGRGSKWLNRMQEIHKRTHMPRTRVINKYKYVEVKETKAERKLRFKKRDDERKRRQKKTVLKAKLDVLRNEWNECITTIQSEMKALAQLPQAQSIMRHTKRLRSLKARTAPIQTAITKLTPIPNHLHWNRWRSRRTRCPPGFKCGWGLWRYTPSPRNWVLLNLANKEYQTGATPDNEESDSE